MKPFLAALKFLTIAPVPSRWAGDETILGRAAPYFPLVGLLIGMVVATLDSALCSIFPSLLASTLTIIALIAASGGLHLDGLADTADGFFSSRPRERILEIMRDSATGAMGSGAIACVIILKLAAVNSVSHEVRWSAILMMPIAGRCSLVILLNVSPYARSEGGLATIFEDNRSVFHPLFAVIVLALTGWITAGPTGLAMAAVSLVGTLAFAFYTQGKIGGYTGDTLGAACEITEILPALAAAAL